MLAHLALNKTDIARVFIMVWSNIYKIVMSHTTRNVCINYSFIHKKATKKRVQNI